MIGWLGCISPRFIEIYVVDSASSSLHPLHGNNFSGKVRSPVSAFLVPKLGFSSALPIQGGPCLKNQKRKQCRFLKRLFLSGGMSPQCLGVPVWFAHHRGLSPGSLLPSAKIASRFRGLLIQTFWRSLLWWIPTPTGVIACVLKISHWLCPP